MEIPDFEPHPLLRSGHAQTVFGTLAPRRPRHVGQATERRLFRTAEDTQVLALCDWQLARRESPTIVLLHGLVGSAEAVYLVGTADKAFARGFNTVRLNMRNCGGTAHLTPTLYHSGLTDDLRAVLRELEVEDGLSAIFVAGFSLGGNVVLKLLGEFGDAAPSALRGAVAVSPPVDLAACSRAIVAGAFNDVYQRRFLRLLKGTMREKGALFPDRYDLSELDRVRTLREFDECFTAPYSGFGDAQTYYERASALPFIPKIRVPTLIVSAEDDGLIPTAPLQSEAVRNNDAVRCVITERGGHIAFIGRRPAAVGDEADLDRRWAENRVVQFCVARHQKDNS